MCIPQYLYLSSVGFVSLATSLSLSLSVPRPLTRYCLVYLQLFQSLFVSLNIASFRQTFPVYMCVSHSVRSCRSLSVCRPLIHISQCLCISIDSRCPHLSMTHETYVTSESHDKVRIRHLQQNTKHLWRHHHIVHTVIRRAGLAHRRAGLTHWTPQCRAHMSTSARLADTNIMCNRECYPHAAFLLYQCTPA